ncbi:dTDP-4-dehydrorhamnose reductase [Leptotrichia sp. oral taxon 879]|uniref:dTDP-4-dehydrorhamnose reductase n=1 Tax=Leptotrichia sp. oral taxon 879 TaxID=1227267 RepID=UPI0003AE5271|nr:dTDP-4-dehydrorhamnose reductase [Leptotrichia sp. oral taxon 879]ERK53643.1 dTDP-4-dehydrorhamnose reductase [Leptotrichia sp. oral taxon 879 str. F0557]
MKILLTGSNGQLGYDFQKLFDNLNIKYIATDYQELDITSEENLEKFFEKNNDFTHIINCVGYNDVDKAEIDSNVFLVNEKAPRKLAEFSKRMNAIFITYSTDFVFDGKKGMPYVEEDIPNPLSKYAISKYKGEKAVLTDWEKSFVIRTSWVFGKANNNFNTQVINWSKTRDKLSIVDDQISAPTYSKDLAEFSWKLIQTEQFGLYHITNNGIASKYEQAKYVLEKIGWKGTLETAKTEDFNLPAKRPHFSKLSSEKVERLLGERIPDWKSGIDRYLEEIEIIKK